MVNLVDKMDVRNFGRKERGKITLNQLKLIVFHCPKRLFWLLVQIKVRGSVSWK